MRCEGIPEGEERCGCRCNCRRDPHAYDYVETLGRKRLLELIQEIIDIAGEPPYEIGVGLGGRRGYPPYLMLALIIYKTLENLSSRKLEGRLEDDPELRDMLGFGDGHPRKSAICNAYSRISPEYLRRVNMILVAEIKRGSLACDSTGVSNNKLEPWSTVKKADGKRKGYKKLHVLLDIDSRVAIDIEVTGAEIADITEFRIFLERLAASDGCDAITADAAYLAREICTIIEELGYIPRIMPKSNSSRKAKGHQAWRRMLEMFDTQYAEFKKQYGQRNIVESVFGSLKQVYGNGLTMRRPERQDAETVLRVVCHNMAYICRNRHLESGSAYPEQEEPGAYRLQQDWRQKTARPPKPPDSRRGGGSVLPPTPCRNPQPVPAEAVIATMLRDGTLQVGTEGGYDADQIIEIVRVVTGRQQHLSFYPPGSRQREAALAVAAEVFPPKPVAS